MVLLSLKCTHICVKLSLLINTLSRFRTAYRSAWPQRRPPLTSWPPCRPARRCQRLSVDRCSCTHVARGSSAAAAREGAGAERHGLQTDLKNRQEPGGTGATSRGSRELETDILYLQFSNVHLIYKTNYFNSKHASQCCSCLYST